MKPFRVYILEDEIITQQVIMQTLESFNCVICGMESNAEVALEEIKSSFSTAIDLIECFN